MVGMTRKGTIPTGPIMRPISDDNMRMSLEDRDGNGEEEEEEEEEEWSGVYGFNNHDHEMDKEFEENGEEEGSTPDGVDNGNYQLYLKTTDENGILIGEMYTPVLVGHSWQGQDHEQVQAQDTPIARES